MMWICRKARGSNVVMARDADTQNERVDVVDKGEEGQLVQVAGFKVLYATAVVVCRARTTASCEFCVAS